MAEKNVLGAPPSSRWISQGVEVLFEEIAKKPDNGRPHFDVLIIGSGYGGSIAAAELSGAQENGRPISVCVLERGIEYLPGMFPTRISELPGHIRFNTPANPRPRGRREGLFDLRLGEDIHAVVANGLGGGSLINAGVLMPPHNSVLLDPAWPADVRRDIGTNGSSQLWTEVRRSLGAEAPAGNQAPDTILDWRYESGEEREPPRKFRAMQLLAADAVAAPISVAMANSTSAVGRVALSACIGCGDCATGCNFGAKISHDVNLLVRAHRQGARIYTGATVLRIKPRRPEGWIVETNYTDDPLRRRQGGPVAVTARRVVLAAGTFGSTEILLRSRSPRFRLSEQLGRRFSGNGDIFAAIWKADSPIDAVADETKDPCCRGIGPAITSVIDRRKGDRKTDYVAQELSVPAPLREIFAEGFTTAQALHDLARCDRAVHGAETTDPIAVDPAIIERSTAIAVIGRDAADGRMTLTDGDDPDAGDGAISVVWPQARNDPTLEARLESFKKEFRALGGQVLPNPAWRLLPANLQSLLGNEAGPLLTVHPLGGCAMGDDARYGVVDHLGRVFRADRETSSCETYDGLVVLDGSIVPTSLGINPALTIATLATRAVRKLSTLWFGAGPQAGQPAGPVQRPVYARPRGPWPRLETSLEFVERMSGDLDLKLERTGKKACIVELTLRFRPVPIVPWLRSIRRRLDVDVNFSRLRIFPRSAWRRNDEMCDADALVIAPLSGSLHVLQREPSRPWQRILRSLWPWFANRGLRDIWQGICARECSRNPLPLPSRAGERRSLRYRLRIHALTKVPKDLPERVTRQLRPGAEIEGYKRLTYSRRACRWTRRLRYARPFNPWWQLATMQIQRFPCWKNALVGPGAELKLDLPYLARVGVPLVRIVEQQNQMGALADLASLAMYLVRLLLHVHIWTFRKPDPVQPRNVDRLPGPIDGLPPPTITWLEMPPPRPGLQVRLRLTRYPAASRDAQPVLLIHGYSASGTTFAHPAVRPGLAEFLHSSRYDVWIVDLRTSAALPTARMGWAFEDAAYADIPLAVDHILLQTGSPKLDIVAHCMGAAMIWMALLGPGPLPRACDWYRHEREALPLRIRKLVASQVGPVNIFSPDNTMRAHVTRYVKFFAPADYRFRDEGNPSLLQQALDRLLASLPYPEDEFDRENPFPQFWKKTPWAGSRHRIDALYARAFELRNVSDAVLDAIDDLFGPLNVDTVSQAIHLSMRRVLTDRYGANRFVTAERIRERLRFPILTIHGERNGLVDSETRRLVESVLKRANPSIEFKCHTVPRAGHQDCLIGSPRREVFKQIGEFLR